MTQVTVGPPWVADGPIPQAPPHNLLSIPGVLLPTPDDDHWLVGIEVWPYPRDLPDTHDACSEGTFRLKAEGEGWNDSIFGPFEVVLPITCSTITAKRRDFANRAEIALKARESYGVSLELATGNAQPLNPHFNDSNVHVLAGGAAVRADVGLAYLEDAIGATAGTGIIHATPAVATAWNGQSGYSVEDVGGVLYTTANRTPVAVSYAYYNVTPSGQSAAPAGSAWVYATGPVQVRRQNEVVMIADTIAESMDRESNEVTFRAERGFVAIYDAPDSNTDTRPVQAAVLIDWTP